MQNTTACVSLAICALLSPVGTAQGNFVSNLDQDPTLSKAIGSDAWIAQPFYIFVTDPNTYVLHRVQLRLDPVSGDPNGFSVSIYSAVNGIPQNLLGDLRGPDDPPAAGIYTYNASGITVSSGHDYYVVARAATPIAEGSYSWSGLNTTTQDGTWVIGARGFESSDGLHWTVLGREEVLHLALYATVVPEPAAFGLAGLGLGFLWLSRRKVQSTAAPGRKVR